MPGSIGLEFAGPTVLKYTLLSGGDAQRTQTQMIADCVNGPLKTLLQSASQANGIPWQNLPLGPRLDLSIRAGANSSVSIPKVAAQFSFNSPDNILFATSDGSSAATITVRFIPTPG